MPRAQEPCQLRSSSRILPLPLLHLHLHPLSYNWPNCGGVLLQVSAGQLHSGCLTADGVGLMWGSNRFHELGLQQSADYDVPHEVRQGGV